ncbi:MAG: hotdog fold domain-containing protein [Myxococcota bacterium]
MAIATFLNAEFLATRSSANVTRNLWDRLSPLPGGSRVFSRIIGRMAPYTGTIKPHITELRPGFSRVSIADRPSVRNHLASVHAVALANLVELTGNIAVAYTLPDDARFIVAGMSLNYVKKSRGTITGECHCPLITTSAKQEYDVRVLLRDDSGDVVVEGTLRTLVGPKAA